MQRVKDSTTTFHHRMKPITFLFLLVCPHFTSAQEPFRAKTAMSVNLGVQTFPYWPLGQARVSFEQEVVYWPKRGVSMGFRLGAGRILEITKLLRRQPGLASGTGMGTAYVLTGRKNHHFEAAVGPEFWFDRNEYTPPVLPYAEAGYRFQKPSNGFFVRGFLGTTSGLGVGVGYSLPVRK